MRSIKCDVCGSKIDQTKSSYRELVKENKNACESCFGILSSDLPKVQKKIMVTLYTPLKRNEITNLTGLDKHTVENNLHKLKRKGLVKVSDRPWHWYRIPQMPRPKVEVVH